MRVVLCFLCLSCAFSQSNRRKVITCFEEQKCRNFIVDSAFVRDVFVRKCALSTILVKGEEEVSVHDLTGHACSK